jgi:hypothetical protein
LIPTAIADKEKAAAEKKAAEIKAAAEAKAAAEKAAAEAAAAEEQARKDAIADKKKAKANAAFESAFDRPTRKESDLAPLDFPEDVHLVDQRPADRYYEQRNYGGQSYGGGKSRSGHGGARGYSGQQSYGGQSARYEGPLEGGYRGAPQGPLGYGRSAPAYDEANNYASSLRGPSGRW